MKTIWFCEDLSQPENSGFGDTKVEAESLVSGNYGYDDYNGANFKQCVADGWSKPAVRITVHEAVAACLLLNGPLQKT
jgi:hypothetical protein